jgi:hypothetical protein
MTERGARAWLPKGAFSIGAVGACLAVPLESWTRRWFLRATAAVAAVRAEEGCAAPAAPQGIRVEGALAALDLGGHGKRRLLEAALDADLAGQPLTDGDRRLLDALARRMAEDLLRLLEETLAPGDKSEAASWFAATVVVGGHDVLDLHVPAHVMVPRIKTFAAPAAGPRQKLTGRSEALKRTALIAHGFLGRAELGLDELKDMSIGDVLILDQALGDPVELRLAGSPAALARGKLLRTDNAVSLQI